MRLFWSVAAVVAALLSGCDEKRPDGWIFVKSAGGQSVEDSSSDSLLASDKKACVEEAQKGTVGLPAAYYQGLDGPITPAMISDRSTRALVEIMKGCMAGKGYVLAPRP